MKSVRFLSVLTAAVSILSNRIFAEPPTLDDIVTAMQDNLNRPPAAMWVESEIYTTDPNGAEPPRLVQVAKTRYFIDGQRVDITTERYIPDKEGLLVLGNFKTRYFSNDSFSFFMQNGLFYLRAPQRVYLSALFNLCHGNVLDGYFLCNDNYLHWTELVLDESGRVAVLPEPETINGRSCLVLKADLVCGSYTLWLDPEQKYTLRKAHIVLDADDLYRGKALSESSMRSQYTDSDVRRYYQTMEICIDNIKTEVIDDRIIPVQGDYRWNAAFDDGSHMGSIRKISRSKIDFDPSFEAMKAFEANLPDGTVLTQKLGNGSYRSYVWAQGKLQPRRKSD